MDTVHRQPPPVALAAVIGIVIVAFQALLVPLFAGPASHLAPRDLPVVVAGPAPATAAIVDRLRTAEPGGFDVGTVADAAAADQAIRDREAYAAFVVGPDGLALHTASGASPTVAALLTQAVQQLAPAGTTVNVVDVVPTDPDDPRGAGFASGFLPLALTSLLAGLAFALAVRRRGARLAGLVGYAALAGLVGAAVLQFWLGILPGTYLDNAGAIALLALAVSAATTGLGAVLGRVGLVLAALLIFLVGNALSGIPAAPELLPQPWGAFGQLLPIGAGGTLLRAVAYFDGAGATGAWFVLGAWAVAGLVLVALRRGERPVLAYAEESPREAVHKLGDSAAE